jgi:hypothetical protein
MHASSSTISFLRNLAEFPLESFNISHTLFSDIFPFYLLTGEFRDRLKQSAVTRVEFRLSVTNQTYGDSLWEDT